MFKMLVFLTGLVAGAGGVGALLLSEPETPHAALDPNDRLAQLRARVNEAIAEGRRAGQETENKLRHELGAYRLHPDRPGVSS